jgi:hypothetical protein
MWVSDSSVRQERLDEHGPLRCRSMMPLSGSWPIAQGTTDWVSPRRSVMSCCRIRTRPLGYWRAVRTSNTSQARRLPTLALPVWFDVLDQAYQVLRSRTEMSAGRENEIL